MSWVETAGKPADIEDPRDRIVQAAAQLLLEEGHTVLAAGLSPEHVGRHAEWTRRNIYNHFPAKSELLAELFRRALAPERSTVTDEIVGSMIQHALSESRGDIVKVLRDVATANFLSASNDRVVTLQMLAWSVGQNDPEIRKNLRELYRSLDRRVGDGFENLFTEWERSFVAPFDNRRCATVLTALTEGLVIRAAVDPDAVDDDMFAWVVMSLFTGISQPKSEPARRIEDAVEVFAQEEALRYRERDEPMAVANARESVYEAVRTQLRLRGYRDLTIEHVATEAGISARTISRRYGDLDTIICNELEEYLHTLENELEIDLDQGTFGPNDRIRRHLLRVATLARREANMVRATISMLMARPPEASVEIISPAEALFVRLTHMLQVAIDGDLETVNTPTPSSITAVQVLMLRAATYFAEDSPEDLVNSVIDQI